MTSETPAGGVRIAAAGRATPMVFRRRVRVLGSRSIDPRAVSCSAARTTRWTPTESTTDGKGGTGGTRNSEYLLVHAAVDHFPPRRILVAEGARS